MSLSSAARRVLLEEIRTQLHVIRREAEALRSRVKAQQICGPAVDRIEAAANQLWWTTSELLDEAVDLEDNLGLHAGSTAHNPDPHLQLRFLHEWLFEDLASMDGLIGRIHNPGVVQDAVADAMLLAAGATLAESYRTIVTAVDALVEDLGGPLERV